MSETGTWVRSHPAIDAEARRARCVVQGDHAQLAKLLAPDLRYVHATGLCHDRAEYLAYLAQGPRFVSIAVEDALVWDLGTAAHLCGRLHMQLIRPGQSEVIHAVSWLSQLWRCDSDRVWQLISLQSTTIATAV